MNTSYVNDLWMMVLVKLLGPRLTPVVTGADFLAMMFETSVGPVLAGFGASLTLI